MLSTLKFQTFPEIVHALLARMGTSVKRSDRQRRSHRGGSCPQSMKNDVQIILPNDGDLALYFCGYALLQTERYPFNSLCFFEITAGGRNYG